MPLVPILGGWILLAMGIVFAAGAILLWQGWRGVPEYSEPFCRQCGYDLRGLNWSAPARTCPECGTDLTSATAIQYGKYRKRPRRMVLGGVVLLLGLFLPLVAGLIAAMVQNRGRLVETNAAIIANLARTADQPWDWQKLENRYSGGSLTRAEAAQAIDQLIAHLKAKPSRGRAPLHWVDRFFGTLLADGVITTEQLGRLSDAFYGPAPELKMRSRLRSGKSPGFKVDPAGGWDLPGLRSMLALREVTVDGKPVDLLPQYTSGKTKHHLSGSRHQQIAGEITSPLEPGKHEVKFQFDRGLVDEKTKTDPRYEGRPGQADRWPPVLVRQAKTVTVELEVLVPGTPAVALVSDPSLNPANAISVAGVEVVPQEGSRKVNLKPLIEIKQPSVPVVFRIFAEINGTRHGLGWYGRYANGTASSLGNLIDDAPPASLKTVRIVLEPDAELAEDHLDVDQIWGKPIVLENVPLERYDLEENASSATRPASR